MVKLVSLAVALSLFASLRIEGSPQSVRRSTGLATAVSADATLLRWRQLTPQGVVVGEGSFDDPFEPFRLRIRQHVFGGTIEITAKSGGKTRASRLLLQAWTLESSPAGRSWPASVDCASRASWQSAAGAASAPDVSAWAQLRLAETLIACGDPGPANAALARAASLIEDPVIHIAIADLWSSHKAEKAIEAFQRAAAAAERARWIQAAHFRVYAWNELAMWHVTRGALLAAEPFAAQSASLLGDADVFAIVFPAHVRAATAFHRRDLDSAERDWRVTLAALERHAPRTEMHARVIDNLANIATLRRDPSAPGMRQRALAIREALDPASPEVGRSYVNRSADLARMGQMSLARTFADRGLALLGNEPNNANDAIGLAEALLVVSDIYGELELFDKTEAAVRRATTLLERYAPDGRQFGWAMRSAGRLAAARGEYPAAQSYFERALAIQERLAPGSPQVVGALGELGYVALLSGDLSGADGLMKRAFDISAKLDVTPVEFATLHRRYGLYCRQRASEGAGDRKTWAERGRAYLASALTITRQVQPQSLNEALSLMDLGIAEIEHDPASAKQHIRDALAIRERLAPGSNVVAESHFYLGIIGKAENNLRDAVVSFARATEVQEAHLTQFGGTWEGRAQYRAQFRAYWMEQVRALLTLGRESEAFEAFERSKTRELLDLFASDRSIPPDQQIRAGQLDFEYESLSRERMNAEAGPAAELRRIEARMKQVREERERLTRGTGEPSKRSQVRPRRESIADVSGALPERTALVSYALFLHDSYVFVLRPDRKFVVHPMARGLREIDASVASFMTAFQRVPDTEQLPADLRQKAKDLYDLLIAPIEEDIDGADRLLILPDRSLYRLPFAALVRERTGRSPQFLGQWKALHFASSAAQYIETQRRHATHSHPAPPVIAIFASGGGAERGAAGAAPRSGSRSFVDDVRAISGIAGTQVIPYVDRAATEKGLRDAAIRASHLHFATHGIFDDAVPLNSALAMADGNRDALLPAWRIADTIQAPVRLAVLAACETGVGKEAGGEGVIGLTQAFQVAGADAVIASLWRVETGATTNMMRELYTHILAGDSPDRALHLAQTAMLRKSAPRLLHPYFWAAFQLYGWPG